ncbi:unnamed protein product, partial [Amoebophrya sp. A25]
VLVVGERCHDFFMQLVTSATSYRASDEDAEGEARKVPIRVDRSCVIICDQGAKSSCSTQAFLQSL